MITKENLTTLSKFPTASWALWNDKGDSNFDFFEQHLDQLHARVVILGLNRSGKSSDSDTENRKKNKKTGPFINFHTPGHTGDGRLKKFIQESNLKKIKGAYMSDLSEEIQTESKLVNIKQESLNQLLEQIDVFASIEQRTIICIGDKPFNELCRLYNEKSYKIKMEPDNHNIRRIKLVVNQEKSLVSG